MVWFTLFIIFLTASKVTSLHCSDQQLPASGDDDLQQITTLQYCLVDNCTIMMIDTGEELDIVYTTNSLIVTSPTDGPTSMIIARLDKELSCFSPTSSPEDGVTTPLVGFLFMGSLIIAVSGYNVIVHLIFKELRKVMGKLIMLYSLLIISQVLIVFVTLMMHNVIALNSQVACQLVTGLFMTATASVEGFATCILTHFAYIMYCNHHLHIVSTKRSEYLYRRYVTYVLGTAIFFLAMIILHDVITGTGRYTLQSNGHCIFVGNIAVYQTVWISKVNTAINKVAQIVMFTIYLFYFDKVKHTLEVSSENSHKLSKVAIAMGATIGPSQLIWLAAALNAEYTNTANIVGSVSYFIQQCVIMSALMCTNKMSLLCRDRFLRNRVAPAPN